MVGRPADDHRRGVVHRPRRVLGPWSSAAALPRGRTLLVVRAPDSGQPGRSPGGRHGRAAGAPARARGRRPSTGRRVGPAGGGRLPRAPGWSSWSSALGACSPSCSSAARRRRPSATRPCLTASQARLLDGVADHRRARARARAGRARPARARAGPGRPDRAGEDLGRGRAGPVLRRHRPSSGTASSWPRRSGTALRTGATRWPRSASCDEAENMAEERSTAGSCRSTSGCARPTGGRCCSRPTSRTRRSWQASRRLWGASLPVLFGGLAPALPAAGAARVPDGHPAAVRAGGAGAPARRLSRQRRPGEGADRRRPARRRRAGAGGRQLHAQRRRVRRCARPGYPQLADTVHAAAVDLRRWVRELRSLIVQGGAARGPAGTGWSRRWSTWSGRSTARTGCPWTCPSTAC